MSQYAPRVMTSADDVKRIEALIGQLPNNARVKIECSDNKEYQGLVCIRPTAQSFRLRDGTEGINSVLRLQDQSAPKGEHRIWLDQIRRVYRLDSISGKFEF